MDAASVQTLLIDRGLPPDAARELALNLAAAGTSAKDVDEATLKRCGAKRGHIRLLAKAREKRGGFLLFSDSDSDSVRSESGASWLESSQDGGDNDEDDEAVLRRLIAEDEARVMAEKRRFETGLAQLEAQAKQHEAKVLEKSR